MSDSLQKRASMSKLHQMRHWIGVAVGLLVAWIPLSEGAGAFANVTRGECGFLCLFLLIALFYWVVALVVGAVTWGVIVFLIKRFAK